MEFVDYKCLESLLTEGEELIATEGFIDTIKGVILGILKTIGGFIDKLIGIIKNKFGKNKKHEENRENATTAYQRLVKYAVDLCNEVTHSASFIINANQQNSTESLNETIAKHIETMEDLISKFDYLYNGISDFYNYYLLFNSIEDHNAIIEKLMRMKAANQNTIKNLENKFRKNNFTSKETNSGSDYNKLINLMNKTTACLAKLIKVSSEMPWCTN